MQRQLLSVLLLPAALAVLAACSDSPAGTCARSSDCERGQSCQSDGKCDAFSCRSASDCLQQDEFQETCLFENNAGNFDPAASGVCSHQECRNNRDCDPGQECLEGACYAGAVAPEFCSCSDDCLAGQACIGGSCTAPLGVCSTDCECAVGAFCDGGQCVEGSGPCQDVTCGEGEVCEEGLCVVVTCDPACGAGENCVDGQCVAPGGGLCAPCSTSADCGGPDDECVNLGTDNVCTASCDAATAPCPDGFICFAVSAEAGSQCVPAGGTCEGCLRDGCADGQYCDPTSTECSTLIAVCDECQTNAQCGAGASCIAYRGRRICLDECGEGTTCETGFTCEAIGSDQVCSPTAGGCGDPTCTETCNPPLGILRTSDCQCVGCLESTDCPSGQACNTAGTCVREGRACSTTAECDGGYCQGGICVECLTAGDCTGDNICLSGACQPCPCPEGQRCTTTGGCVDIPDPSSCSNDSECVGWARELGHSGTGATCDPTVGCVIAGNCNGAAGGSGDPFADIFADLFGGGGGEEDPFDAECPAGTRCEASGDIFGALLGGGGTGATCTGCTPGDPSTCRAGETCSAGGGGFLPGMGEDSEPSCVTEGGGGGGFPFPFP